MPARLTKIAFVLEDFRVPSPAQQLLDRFLIGFPDEGVFRPPPAARVSVWLPDNGAQADLDRRRTDHGLERETAFETALRGAAAWVCASGTLDSPPPEGMLRRTIERAEPGSAGFVPGLLAPDWKEATELIHLARSRRIRLLAGTALPFAWHLPEVSVAKGARIKEALIVTQGPFPLAELMGLEGLLPELERRRGGETGIRRVRGLFGPAVWPAGDRGDWPWPLLAAAISRSNTPQGDPVADGRTQDLVGLGLVPGLAREPRGWLLEHRDGVRSAILALDGVVADINFAVRLKDGSMISAQVYQAPPPAQHQYSRLSAALAASFAGGAAPWPVDRNRLTAGILEEFRAAQAAQQEGWVATPELEV